VHAVLIPNILDNRAEWKNSNADHSLETGRWVGSSDWDNGAS